MQLSFTDTWDIQGHRRQFQGSIHKYTKRQGKGAKAKCKGVVEDSVGMAHGGRDRDAGNKRSEAYRQQAKAGRGMAVLAAAEAFSWGSGSGGGEGR